MLHVEHVEHVTCLPQLASSGFVWIRLAPLNPHALRHQCHPLRKLGTVVLARPVVGVKAWPVELQEGTSALHGWKYEAKWHKMATSYYS